MILLAGTFLGVQKTQEKRQDLRRGRWEKTTWEDGGADCRERIFHKGTCYGCKRSRWSNGGPDTRNKEVKPVRMKQSDRETKNVNIYWYLLLVIISSYSILYLLIFIDTGIYYFLIFCQYTLIETTRTFEVNLFTHQLYNPQLHELAIIHPEYRLLWNQMTHFQSMIPVHKAKITRPIY